MIKDYSATPVGYLASAGRVHFSTWSGRFFKDPVDSFFPGFVILALAGVAIVARVRAAAPAGSRRSAPRARDRDAGRDRRGGVVLSLGMATPVYGWLFAVFPPMQGLRAAARFGNLFLLAVAVLGGMRAGDASRAASAFRRQAAGSAIALVVLVNVESLRAPMDYSRSAAFPASTGCWPPSPGPVVLAEQPFFPRWAIFLNGPYVLASTAHWRPLMNGYSGYTPGDATSATPTRSGIFRRRGRSRR